MKSLVIEYLNWMPIIVFLVPMLLAVGIMLLSDVLKLNRRIPALINAFIYIIVFLYVLELVPIEALNLWQKITSRVEWLWDFIPKVSMITLYEITYYFCYRILLPCCSLWFGIQYFVIGVWRDNKFNEE